MCDIFNDFIDRFVSNGRNVTIYEKRLPSEVCKLFYNLACLMTLIFWTCKRLANFFHSCAILSQMFNDKFKNSSQFIKVPSEKNVSTEGRFYSESDISLILVEMPVCSNKGWKFLN